MSQTDPKREMHDAEPSSENQRSESHGVDTGGEFRESAEQSSEVARSGAKEGLSEKISVVGKIGKIVQGQSVEIPAPLPKTPVRLEIESVLSEHVNVMISHMDPQTKAAFKLEASETASTIEKLVSTAKATAKKVIRLITAWLRMIPGVNEFYIEQEAKIKADKILELQNRHPKSIDIIKEEA